MGSSNGGNGNPRLKDRLFDLYLDEVEIQKILTARAATLAQIPGQMDQGLTLKQYVTFKLGDERYGVDVSFVEEIQPLKDLTLIPCTPDFVVGAVNIRGSILPVVDVKKFFGIPEAGIADFNKGLAIRVGEMHL